MPPRFVATGLLGGLLLLCLTGCGTGARSVTLPFWQKNVEQYVKQYGDGDPTVLRDVYLPDSRRGFSVIGSDRPAESSDVNGVLLGYRQIAGNYWLVYLVGVVKKQSVDEIRITALTADGGAFNWKVGNADTKALATYTAFGDRMWRERFVQRGLPPPEYLGFPRPDDHFQLNVTGEQISVVHTASGATWTLSIAPPTGTRHAQSR
jgi:hypothetical protein